jgi:hypothetical protein
VLKVGIWGRCLRNALDRAPVIEVLSKAEEHALLPAKGTQVNQLVIADVLAWIGARSAPAMNSEARSSPSD